MSVELWGEVETFTRHLQVLFPLGPAWWSGVGALGSETSSGQPCLELLRVQCRPTDYTGQSRTV